MELKQNIRVLKVFEILGILLFAFLIFWPSLLHLYLDIDEVLWAEFAHALLKGCPPYVCIIGEKPPLLYLTYAAIFKIFGTNNYFALHLFHIFLVAASAYLLNQIFQKYFLKRENFFSYLPAFFYLLFYALPEFRTLAATGESFMNLFLIASFALFLKIEEDEEKEKQSSQIPYLWMGMGILVALASLYRHQAAVQILVYLFLLFRSRRECFFLIFSFLFIWILMSSLLYFWGAWPKFWEWGILHNFGYIENGMKAPGVWKTGLENLALFFGKTIFFWILAFAALKRSAFLERKQIFLMLSLFASVLAACPGFRFFPHYLIQTYPALAILSVMGLKFVWNDSQVWAKIVAKFFLALSFLLALVQNFLVPYFLESDSTQDYSSLNQRIGIYLERHSKPTDTIVVWGWAQGIYAYADRRMGTRFIASDFLTGRIPASQASQYLSLEDAQKFAKPRAWEEFFLDLEKNKPLYFINTSPANMHDYHYFPPHAYPHLKEYLDQNYHLENTLEKIEIYRRN